MSIHLDHIRIVLVETSHPGNIGSAARAMKTMGFKNLVLVNPKRYPHPQAIELSAGADDILENARYAPNLQAAIGDCELVIGTSARPRYIELPELCPKTCATTLQQQAVPTALVFGRERTGLNNDELIQCHYHVMIPSNPDYSSLNLAQAVQVLCYETRQAALAQQPNIEKPRDYASHQETSAFYTHLEQVIQTIDFAKPGQAPYLMPKLQRLFNRTRLEKNEINILRGILTAIEKSHV